MSEKEQISTFNIQLDQLLRGEVIHQKSPELAFAQRLRAADLSPRSHIYESLNARLLARLLDPLNFQEFLHPSWRTSFMNRFSFLKPTLVFGAVMVLLILFLVWALTNTTPQPAVMEATPKGFSLLALDYQGVICCGEGRAEWLDAETLQVSQELTIPFARGIIASPDGNVIFDQGYGEENQLISLDLLTGEQTSLVTAPEIVAPMSNYPVPFAISPDGERLVTAHYDFTGEGDAADITRFWRSVFDLSTNTLLYKFPPEPEHVREAETPACLMPIMMISQDANYLHELCIWGGSYPLSATPTIRTIDLNSGEILRTYPVFYAWGAVLSPDSSQMYVLTTLGDILVLNTQNLEILNTFELEALVTNYAGGRRAVLSQDGRTLFVSLYSLTGRHQFFAINTQTGEITAHIEGEGSIDSIVVAPDKMNVFTLAMLPEGKAIITAHDPVTLESKFARLFEGKFTPKQLIGVLVDIDPSITENEINDGSSEPINSARINLPASFSAQIVFETTREGNGEIYLMNPDGSQQTNLTNNPTWDRYPVWSPDGSKIAFLSDRSGSTQVYIIDLQKNRTISQLTYYTQIPEVSVCLTMVKAGKIKFLGFTGLHWSPDGRYLVSSLGMDIDGNMFQPLYLINADGSGMVQLTDDGNDINPQWSPTGSHIAFTRLIDCDGEADQDIFIIRANGEELYNLTNTQTREGIGYSWSQDGSQLVYFNMHENGEKMINLVNINGTDQKTLLTLGMDDVFGEGSLVWSPDSDQIAFISSYTTDEPQIYLINKDGSGLMPITNQLVPYSSLDWSHDGTLLLVSEGNPDSQLVFLYLPPLKEYMLDFAARIETGVEGANAKIQPVEKVLSYGTALP